MDRVQGKVESHRDLVVWQKAMDLAEQVCRQCNDFPRAEMFGLAAQLRRAAASVPANIAEGSARGTTKDYVHFLAVAKGSLMEAETSLTLAVRLGYLRSEDASPLFGLVTEISKMLTALRAKLKT